ncbi:MAG: serine/threonine protein kinase [Deltaproteobacteria bacterium]|nr:serine/threonine protein kinase [Deltaproteobacteria bacterium]
MTKPRPFGHYFILEKIAQGGMAEIFKGLTYDFTGLKKFVVIKRILPHIAANKEFIRMLIDEAKIAVSLTHGSIAQTYDLGKVGRDYFIVMEYVDGKTISQIIKRSQSLHEPIPIPIIAYILSELCSGLDYIHRRTDEAGDPLHIVHRDISPQNIIVSYSGSVKIVDFGVAKAAMKASEAELGVLKGKFAYMSPEQTEGTAVDHRSDIFSAGIVLWEMLGLKRLFKKKTNADTVAAVKYQEFIAPSDLRPEVPADLDVIAQKALAKDPNVRYTSAQEMSLDLTKFILKYYPDFKQSHIVTYLEKIFTGLGEDTVAYQEKTILEEKSKATSKDLNQSTEETVLVDSRALDFRSIFDDIDVEDPSEHTKFIDFSEIEATIGIEGFHELSSERQENSKTVLLSDLYPKKTNHSHLKRNLTLGLIALLLLAGLGFYIFKIV